MTNPRLTFIERLALLAAILILPLHFMALRTLQNNTILRYRDYLFDTTLALTIILGVSLSIQYIVKRPFLTVFFGCHQNHERSLTIMGNPFILCARCTGILLGIFLSLMLPFTLLNPLVFLLGIIPITVDGFLQHFGVITSTNKRRFITGILFAPSFIVLFSFYHYLVLRIMAIIGIFH